MALAAVACLTACDDTSSSSYEIPTYKSDTSLPDTCSMEVAKVDTAYFACFENKWIEVTDSATIEQLKEGLDEEEIKAKLEELETLLVKPANNTPKPTSSSAQSEVEGSDDEEDSSSSSEEEEEYSSSSKKKKNKDKDNDDSGSGSGEGGSGSGEETVKKCGDETYDPKTQICGEGNKVLSKCGESGYDPETQVCGAGNKVLGKCGDETFNPETEWCRPKDHKVIAIANTECCGDKKSCSFSYEERPTRYYDKTDEFCAIHNDTPTRIYKKVTIGTQTWMAENLNYETESGSTCRGTKVSECGYGRFYKRDVALSKEAPVCPSGWHLPSDSEFEKLVAEITGKAYSTSNDAGYKLKTREGWGEGYNGDDYYGFSVMPSGYTNSNGVYESEGKTAMFWSSTTSESIYHYVTIRDVNKILNIMSLDLSSNAERTIRCVKD